MPQTERKDKICWICLNYCPDTSMLPITFGQHCEDYQTKWNNATNKQHKKFTYCNNVLIDELCAPICFNCAH